MVQSYLTQRQFSLKSDVSKLLLSLGCPQKKTTGLSKGISEQFLHNTDCFSPLCCEIYTKDEIRVLRAAEVFRAWKGRNQSPRSSFSRKSRSHRECRDLWAAQSSFSILSSTSVLSPVLSLSLSQLPPAWSCALPEKEMNFALELFVTMYD